MISSDALNNLVNKYQTTELSVRREYIQHLFLSYFFQRPASDKIYFKGGTALRLLFNSPWFSYDLYFILRANLLPAPQKAILRQVLETLKHAEINFERELKQFLPKSHWAQIRGFPETLEREIEGFCKRSSLTIP